MSGTVQEVSSRADLDSLCRSHSGQSALLLWAPWHPPSVHFTKVLEAMAVKETKIRFGKANTDVCTELATHLGATQVPFVAFLNNRGEKIDSCAGADPPKLLEKVKLVSSATFRACAGDGACSFAPRGMKPAGACSNESSGTAAGGNHDLNHRLKNLVNHSPVVLFMKGDREEPKCGFSRKAVALLNNRAIDYSTFDILSDNEVRQGLKEYSNWKTYPQLYIKGELIGGIDIMQEMDEDGSLMDALAKENDEAGSLNSKLHSLVNSANVMLFMKGTREQPFCGFSRQAISLLNSRNVDYNTFDILSDEEVRQGLKEYSNWKTYPQLYVKGELVGGLDIMKEMDEDGSLVETISPTK